MLPKLRLLDDEPLADIDKLPSRSASVFDEDWKLIDDLVREGMMVTESKVEDMPGEMSMCCYLL